jgi:molecular chaperone GrpE
MPSSPESEAGAPPHEPVAPEQAEREAEPTPDLAAELARMEDRYKRALADLDNYRKRAARELERLSAERRDALLVDWLEVVDGLERALAQHPEGALAEGLQAVLGQMDAVLARQGARRIGAVGERFDPERHEAIGTREDSEHPDMTVVEVARSGVALGDRVLRPAQVIVARSRPSVG